MTRLFDKYAPLKARVDMMLKMGSDALGVESVSYTHLTLPTTPYV